MYVWNVCICTCSWLPSGLGMTLQKSALLERPSHVLTGRISSIPDYVDSSTALALNITKTASAPVARRRASTATLSDITDTDTTAHVLTLIRLKVASHHSHFKSSQTSMHPTSTTRHLHCGATKGHTPHNAPTLHLRTYTTSRIPIPATGQRSEQACRLHSSQLKKKGMHMYFDI